MRPNGARRVSRDYDAKVLPEPQPVSRPVRCPVRLDSHPLRDAEPDPVLVARLRAAGCVFAEDEAALLTEAVEGRADAAADLERMVARRVAGEPLEQVLGWAEFAGLRILLEPAVFVPRRRTELLAAKAAAFARAIADEGRTAGGRRPVLRRGGDRCGRGGCRRRRRARRGRRRPGRRAGRPPQPRTARRPRGRRRPVRRAAPRPARASGRARRQCALRAHRRDRDDAARGARPRGARGARRRRRRARRAPPRRGIRSRLARHRRTPAHRDEPTAGTDHRRARHRRAASRRESCATTSLPRRSSSGGADPRPALQGCVSPPRGGCRPVGRRREHHRRPCPPAPPGGSPAPRNPRSGGNPGSACRRP